MILTVYYIYTAWPKVFEQYKFQMIHNNKLIIYLMSLTPPGKCKFEMSWYELSLVRIVGNCRGANCRELSRCELSGIVAVRIVAVRIVVVRNVEVPFSLYLYLFKYYILKQNVIY